MSLKRAYSKRRPTDEEMAAAVAGIRNPPSLQKPQQSDSDEESEETNPSPKSSSLDDLDIDSIDPNSPESMSDELPSALRRTSSYQASPSQIVEELDNALPASTSDDIFDYVHAEVISKQNRYVKYKIMKEGQFVGYLAHPLSWDKIQEMYGGGTFQVQAIATDTNEVVRKQTMAVASVPRNLDSGQTRHTQQPAQQDSKQMMDTIKMVMEMAKAMNPPAEGKKGEHTAGSSLEQTLQLMMAMKTLDGGGNKSDNSMTAILEAMKMQSQNSQTMFMEIAKMTQATSEKLMASTQALVAQMNDKMERLEEKRAAETARLLETIADLKNNDDDDRPDFHQMQMDATAQAMKFMEMIDEKANQKAERLAQESGILPPPEKPSMVEKMIEQALPMLAGFAGGLSKAAPTPAQEALPAAAPQPEGLPSAMVVDREALRREIREEEAAKLREQLKRELAERSRRRAAVPQQRHPETVETTVAAPASEPEGLPTAVPPTTPQVKRAPLKKALQLSDEQLMERYQAVVTSMVQSYSGSQTPSAASDAIRGTVPSLPVFLREAPLARILNILTKNGVSDAAILKYVEDVYANLNLAARSAGKSPQPI